MRHLSVSGEHCFLFFDVLVDIFILPKEREGNKTEKASISAAIFKHRGKTITAQYYSVQT